MARTSKMQVRRGTASQWCSANPVLSSGETGFETDTRKFKVGDGSTAWNSLRYVGFDGGSLDSEMVIAPTLTGSNVQIAIGNQSSNNVGLSLVFSEVQSSGTTAVIATKSQESPTLPANFLLNNSLGQFQISTSAVFAGSVLLNFVLPSSVTQQVFDSVRIFKFSSGVTTDVTVLNGQYAPNFATRTVYASVTSFSEFYVIPSVAPTTTTTTTTTAAPTTTTTAAPTTTTTAAPTTTTTTTAAPTTTTTTTAAPAFVAATSLAAMNIGAWGDPHFYIRKPQTLNPSDYTRGVFLAKWDDNKAGTSGLNEIRFIDLQTTTDTVKIFYTNKQWNNGAKVVSNIRVELNGNSTTYTNNADVTAGPITMKIIKFGSGSNAYLMFEMKWNSINNVVKFKGALCMILKRMSATKGVFNGGSGLLWDGFGRAGQPYGLSRASFETNNVGMLTDDSAEVFSGSENQDFEDVSTASTAETAFDEGLNNNGDGAGNAGDNQPVSQWDDTHQAATQTMAAGGQVPGGAQSETSPYPQLMNKIEQISW
jgi:hypothetical protein